MFIREHHSLKFDRPRSYIRQVLMKWLVVLACALVVPPSSVEAGAIFADKPRCFDRSLERSAERPSIQHNFLNIATYLGSAVSNNRQ